MAGLLKPVSTAIGDLLAQYGVNDYAFAIRGPGAGKAVRVAFWIGGSGEKGKEVEDIERL